MLAQTDAIHRNTPDLMVKDPRGLTVRSVRYWRSVPNLPARPCIHRTLHNAVAQPTHQWDPRLWELHQSDPLAPASLITLNSLGGQVLKSVSVDAGEHISLLGIAGQKMLTCDGRATQRVMAYDTRLRPLAVHERAVGGDPVCTERFSYGGAEPANRLRNQCGQLMRHDDPAGTLLFDAYNLRERCIAQTRHFTLASVVPDWPLDVSERDRLNEPGAGATSRWRFNPLDEVLAQTDARENLQTFRLTLDGRLRESHVQLSGQANRRPVVSAIEYNAEGRIEREVAGNGVRSILGYCPADGRLIERLDQREDGKPLQHLLYTYDRIGNVLSIEDQAIPVRFFANQRIDPFSRYRYDSLYQVIAAFGWEAGAANKGPGSAPANDPAQLANYQQTFRYDAAGNLLGLTHVGAQSPGRELTAARYSNRCLPEREGRPPTEEEIAAAFDANGNLMAMYPGQDLTWNLRNQLHSVRPVVRASGLNDDESYRYDGAGQRVSKVRTLYSRGRSIVSQVRYLPGLELRSNRDGLEVLHVITVQGGLNSVRVLHWETAPSGATPDDQWRLSLTDHVGSSTLELDGQACFISHETYYPFGETAWYAGQDTVESSSKTLRYSGKERDATGLYYYGFRYYDPGLQRWLNPDPAGAVDGLNRYRAMRNNPLFYRDADGLVPVPNQKTTDSVYQDLSREGVVHPLQAAGMQPIRNFFADSEDAATQAYRREIPIALEELGAGGNMAFTNTHQAHVIAAARTQTASPSGAVLYHSGEVMSGVMNHVVGEEITSRVMGPMSVAFNSPVESAQVLAERRDAVAGVMQVGGKLASFSRNPAVSAAGHLAVAYGRLMKVSEAQTQMQYRQLTTPRTPVVEGTTMRTVEVAAPRSLMDAGQPLLDATALPRSPSSLALRLLEAGFGSNGPGESRAAIPHAEPQVPVRRRSRSSSIGR